MIFHSKLCQSIKTDLTINILNYNLSSERILQQTQRLDLPAKSGRLNFCCLSYLLDSGFIIILYIRVMAIEIRRY